MTLIPYPFSLRAKGTSTGFVSLAMRERDYRVRVLGASCVR